MRAGDILRVNIDLLILVKYPQTRKAPAEEVANTAFIMVLLGPNCKHSPVQAFQYDVWAKIVSNIALQKYFNKSTVIILDSGLRRCCYTIRITSTIHY